MDSIHCVYQRSSEVEKAHKSLVCIQQVALDMGMNSSVREKDIFIKMERETDRTLIHKTTQQLHISIPVALRGEKDTSVHTAVLSYGHCLKLSGGALYIAYIRN